MKNKSSHKNNSLSREDIFTYRSTQDQKVKHSIEEKSLLNDFDMDALDGWSESNVKLTSLTKTDKKFIPSKKWLLLSTIFTILFTIILVFSIKNKPQKVNLVATSQTIEHTDIHIPLQIKEMEEIPEHKQILPKTIREDFGIMQDLEKEHSNSNHVVEDISSEELPLHHYEKSEIATDIKVKKINAKEIYLHDLKLVDYREYRSKPVITTKQIIITGTPANKENENSSLEENNEWKNIDIPYIEYIDKTISIFGKGNYKKALTRLEVILKTYPDDINANFYAGLCYYNLKESVKSISAFENCLNSEFTNFAEEAEWYLVKSYQQNGEADKASVLKEKIKKDGGYYSQF